MFNSTILSTNDLISYFYAEIDYKFERFKYYDSKFKQNVKNMLVAEHLKFCGLQKMLDIYGSPDEVYNRLRRLCKNHVGEPYRSSELKKDILYVSKAVESGYNFYCNSYKGIPVNLFVNNEKNLALYQETKD